MIVRCPECDTKFRLSEAQTRGRDQVRLRCSRCEIVFTARLAEEPVDARGATQVLQTGSDSSGPPRRPDGFSLDAAARPDLDALPTPDGGDPFADLQQALGPADTPAGGDLLGLSGFLGDGGGRRYDDELASIDGGDVAGEPSRPGFDPNQLDSLARNAFGREDSNDSAIERAGDAAGSVDPFDAFHDVFAEDREEASADVQQALNDLDAGRDDAPRAPGELAFDPGDGGSLELADPYVAGDEDPAPAEDDTVADEESELLDLALQASESRAPKAPPIEKSTPPEVRGNSDLIRLDIAGDRARHRKETSRGAGLLAFAWTLLLTVATLIGALGWLAWQNDGLIDLRELDQMLGVAFRGETYEPRAVSIVRVYEQDGRIVEQPLDTLHDAERDELVVEDVETSRYVARSGPTMVVVHGSLTNRSDATWRNVRLLVQLRDSDGIALDQVVVPIGGELGAEVFEAGAADLAALDEAWDELAVRAAALEIAPNQQTRFTAAFRVPDDAVWDDVTWSASPWQAQRYAPDTCWDQIAFTSDAAAALAADAVRERTDSSAEAALTPAEGSTGSVIDADTSANPDSTDP